MLLLTGIISYNYTNTSYAKWSSSTESKNVLKLSVKVPNIDESGANAPELTSNMIPVYYDETSNVWRKASEKNQKTTLTYVLGDVDGNGIINSFDASTIVQCNAGTSLCTNPWYLIVGDINGDGKLTDDDCNLIQDYVLKNEVDYPIGKEQTVIIDTTWYNYKEKKWANAVTVTETNRDTYLKSDVGTIIPMDDINTMWVWIPRYTYTYLNTNTPQSINIKFESGTNSSGTIKCTEAVTGTSSISEICTDTTNGSIKVGTSTYTHPAFWWDKNDDGIRTEDEELTGIWIGKFETSSDTTCTVTAHIKVGSGCNLQTIRPLIKPNVPSWRGAQLGTFFNGIQKMRESGNQYGFATADETHMIKNMEWGAVAYLSHSKYGINKEIAINSANTYATGCGPQSEGSISSGSTCNGYTTTLGQSASTTGNISGVYDMSGGSFEYVMGTVVYSDGKQMSGYSTTNNYNSAFTGILYDDGKGTSFTGTYSFPSKRYYDKYSYGTSNTEFTRGKLGDATKEMAPTGTTNSWYETHSHFVGSSNPWFTRGGDWNYPDNSGSFGFGRNFGGAYSNYSSRAVLSILK